MSSYRPKTLIWPLPKDTDLAKHVGIPQSDTQDLQDALYAEISTHVVVTPSSQYLFVITYANADPLVAMQVVKAVITNYGEESAVYATNEGAQLLSSYQGQLKAAQQQADSATQKASDYYQAHNLTATSAQTDPQYQALSQQALQAQTALAAIKTSINTINQSLASLESGLYYRRLMRQRCRPNRRRAPSRSCWVEGLVLRLGFLAVLAICSFWCGSISRSIQRPIYPHLPIILC